MDFKLYGTPHLLTLVFLTSVSIFLIFILKKKVNSKEGKIAIASLAFLCFISYPANQLAIISSNSPSNLENTLPLHLCDLSAFICGFALLTRQAILCELAYFWGIAGTLQGLITPNLSYAFPHPIYFAFFLLHGSIVVTAIVLPLGLRWKPRTYAATRAYGYLLIYAFLMFGINRLLGTNFGFLIEKPTEASLLDYLGVWPWYILWTLGIATFIFGLLTLPFKRKRVEQS